MQLMGGEVDSVVCFSWVEDGQEREFTVPGTSSFRTSDGSSGSLPPVGHTLSVWNRDELVVTGTVESVATAFVENQRLLDRWETHVRLKVTD